MLFECDVANEAQHRCAVRLAEGRMGHLDFVVHAIGFSDKNELRGRYVDTSAPTS
jgi:enoyl-[acyl-carrier protein] reductase I